MSCKEYNGYRLMSKHFFSKPFMKPTKNPGLFRIRGGNLLKAALFTGIFCQAFLAAGRDITPPNTTIGQNHASGDSTIKTIGGAPLKAEDISPLLIGEFVPDLKLVSAEGKDFDLNQFISQKPTILIFYRGGWCPYCSKQLSGLQQIEPELTAMGYQIIAVSTDSPENLTKTLGKEKLSYTLLSDADLKAAKQFGIAYKAPANYDKFLPETSGGKNVDKLIPVPSVFMLNKKGSIRFEYINPHITERISPDLLKAAAKSVLEEI